MTLSALKETIKRLIIARRDADDAEQARINIKLDKLYNLKYLMLEQQANQG